MSAIVADTHTLIYYVAYAYNTKATSPDMIIR
jgi:hypothetical protein